MPDLDRRQFLTLSAGLCAACALGGSLAEADPATFDPVDVGPASDYPKDGISDKFAKDQKFFVVRNDGKLYAVSNKCTHRGFACVAAGDEIVCHKHNSHFSIEGTVESGPAQSTLPRYAIATNDKGHIVVDRNTSFREKEFEDPKSFIKI